MVRHRNFVCFGGCDLPHRLKQAKTSRSGINLDLN
jgi:hypothetical protein